MFVRVRSKEVVQFTASAFKTYFYWISISSFTERTALPYEVSEYCLSFNRFFFDDVEENQPGFKCFDVDIATSIINVLESYNQEFPVIINCDAGLSRSATVASFYHDFILKSLRTNVFEKPPYFPNTEVKRILKKVYMGY